MGERELDGYDTMAAGCILVVVLAGVLMVGWIIVDSTLLDEGVEEIPEPSTTSTVLIGSPCMQAFEDAANVSEMHDTHEDLFPAYSACSSIEQWEMAHARYPRAIDGGNPVEYAMRVCAGNQEALGDTPICQAINAPPEEVVVLQVSGRTGLLGVPLPEGARLTESTSGNLAEYVDPTETYAISASASEITAFFNREMVRAGWFKSATGMFIQFEKGSRVLGIYVSDSKFTLMGS